MRSVGNGNFGAPYSAIPSVDRVMRDPAVEAAAVTYGRAIVAQELRALPAGQRPAIEQRQDPPYH